MDTDCDYLKYSFIIVNVILINNVVTEYQLMPALTVQERTTCSCGCVLWRTVIGVAPTNSISARMQIPGKWTTKAALHQRLQSEVRGLRCIAVETNHSCSHVHIVPLPEFRVCVCVCVCVCVAYLLKVLNTYILCVWPYKSVRKWRWSYSALSVTDLVTLVYSHLELIIKLPSHNL